MKQIMHSSKRGNKIPATTIWYDFYIQSRTLSVVLYYLLYDYCTGTVPVYKKTKTKVFFTVQ